MKIAQIYDILNQISPFELQENWDNSGLIIGDKNKTVTQVLLALDVSEELLLNTLDNTLIITHHPLIFKGLKTLQTHKYPASLINIMLKKDISLISMHTNFDKTHLNLYVAKNILGYDIIKHENYQVHLNIQQSFENLCSHVKQAFELDSLKVVNTKSFIKTAILTTGSGGDFINEIEVDCFISSDIKYHHALMAQQNNLNIIDIGHYESERYFAEALMQDLKNFPLKVIMSNHKNPFEYK